MKNIGILTALDSERGQLDSLLGKPLKTDLYGHFLVKCYVYRDKNIYFVKSGVGEILASAATMLLITVYHVDAIINYGFAGGTSRFNIGDSVVIDSVCHYDMDTSAVDGCARGVYFGMFDDPLIPTDSENFSYLKVLNDFSHAKLASADKFVTDPAVKKELFDTFGTEVFDMEAAAVLIVSKASGVSALILKVISDNGNADEYFAFNELVKATKIKFIEFLSEVLAEI